MTRLRFNMQKDDEVRLRHMRDAAREKKTIGARREPAMRVCAFLNRRGGQVLFGVTRAGEK